eukprot:4084765-Amphidinium_carterae.1
MAEYVGWALGIEIHHLCSAHWPAPCLGQCAKCCVSDRNRLQLSNIFTQHFVPVWRRAVAEVRVPNVTQLRDLKDPQWPPHPNRLLPQPRWADVDSVVSSEDEIPAWAQEDEIPAWAQGPAVPHSASADSAHAASAASSSNVASAPASTSHPASAGTATLASAPMRHAASAAVAGRTFDAEVHRARSRSASVARGAKAGMWQEQGRPRGRGKIPPQPSQVRAEFQFLLEEWLYARGIAGCLTRKVAQEAREQEAHELGSQFGLRRWQIYDYAHGNDIPPHWVPAYHGTWWYALWSILQEGVLLEANDSKLGHDFWMPGTYCTPLLKTAMWYARPHIVFGDAVYHRAVLELRVDKSRVKTTRCAFQGKYAARCWRTKNGSLGPAVALPPERDIPQPVDKANINFQPVPDYDVDASSLVSEEPEDEAVLHTAFLRPSHVDGVRSKAAGAPPPRPALHAADAAFPQPVGSGPSLSQAASAAPPPPKAAGAIDSGRATQPRAESEPPRTVHFAGTPLDRQHEVVLTPAPAELAPEPVPSPLVREPDPPLSPWTHWQHFPAATDAPPSEGSSHQTVRVPSDSGPTVEQASEIGAIEEGLRDLTTHADNTWWQSTSWQHWWTYNSWQDHAAGAEQQSFWQRRSPSARRSQWSGWERASSRGRHNRSGSRRAASSHQRRSQSNRRHPAGADGREHAASAARARVHAHAASADDQGEAAGAARSPTRPRSRGVSRDQRAAVDRMFPQAMQRVPRDPHREDRVHEEQAVEMRTWMALNRVSIIGSNWGALRGNILEELNRPAHIHLVCETITGDVRRQLAAHHWTCATSDLDGGPAVVVRSGTFTVADTFAFTWFDRRDPPEWQQALICARLSITRPFGEFRELVVAAMHVRNTAAKKPDVSVRLLAEAQDMMHQFGVQIAYVDANQAAFVQKRSLSTIDFVYPASAGWLQSSEPGAGSLLGRTQEQSRRYGMCTGFL